MGKIQKNKEVTLEPFLKPIRASGAVGDLRLHEIRSRVFRNTRFLRVWLPPGYDDAQNAARPTIPCSI
jgi:hypothetical protein